MSDFVHLHCHSEYSLLDGLAQVDDLVEQAKLLGMDALAITDHGAMYGVVKFYLACKKAGIKPIIGVEAYLAEGSRFDKDKSSKENYHLVLLAKNNKGYKNLITLVTKAHLEGFYYKPRMDKEILKEYSEGLIGLSACLNGEISQAFLQGQKNRAEELAREYADIFGEGNFYLEIQSHPKIEDQGRINKEIVLLSRKLGIPLVATNDTHYLTAEDAEAHEILLCVQTQRTILESDRPLSLANSPDFYLRSSQEMKGLFVQYPEAIENTVKIAQMCNVEIELGKWILPNFTVPEGETAATFLAKDVADKVKLKFPVLTEEIQKRIDYELDVIIKKGYPTYFLIVSDFVNWAKHNEIAVGPGRGSAAGSLVAYILNITEVDPLKYALPFERFLNPGRPSPPDIDLDFADDRRDEVIAYVTNKYGKDKVAQIITFGKMEARQSIRDVGRALGMPYSQPDRISKMIPVGALGLGMTIDKAMTLSPELNQAYKEEPETKRLIDLSRKLEGIVRHASVHAAGIVISDEPLTEYVPLQKESRGDKIITQYDMYCLDLNASNGKAIGLLKMDLLGLRNLSILQACIKFVSKTHGEKVDISKIDLTDKSVYKLIAEGNTTGVFQLESRGMRNLARELKPNKFTDIAAMVALFRPGPMEWIPSFIEAKSNPKLVKYPHPDLKEVLAETYGIVVYQEQVMQIASSMAGYSMVEADNFRMAMGKKKPEAMKKEKVRFIDGCTKKGYSQETAQEIFSLIEKFAGYGFNKPHSASYAMIAYQTAYMKTKYPVEFMTAVLTAESRSTSGPIREEKISRAIMECKRMKIELLPPDINKSDIEFSIEHAGQKGKGGIIRFGLSAIKNVGSVAIECILSSRRKKGVFTSFTDFVSSVDLSKVNKKTLESLIKAGAFDIFGKRSALLSAYPQIVAKANPLKSAKLKGQDSLFSLDESLKETKDNLPEMDELAKEELLAFERQFLGFYLTEHPLSPFVHLLEKKVSVRLANINTKQGTVVVGGIITGVRKIFTKNGNNEMAFVKIDDLTASVEVVVFPSIFEKTRLIWRLDNIVLIKGKINQREDRLSIIVEDAKLMTIDLKSK